MTGPVAGCAIYCFLILSLVNPSFVVYGWRKRVHAVGTATCKSMLCTQYVDKSMSEAFAFSGKLVRSGWQQKRAATEADKHRSGQSQKRTITEADHQRPPKVDRPYTFHKPLIYIDTLIKPIFSLIRKSNSFSLIVILQITIGLAENFGSTVCLYRTQLIIQLNCFK